MIITTQFKLDDKIIEISDEDLSDSLEYDYEKIKNEKKLESTTEYESIYLNKIVIKNTKEDTNNE